MLRPVFFICLLSISGSLTLIDAQTFSTPVSVMLIEGELVLPNGDSAKFFVQDGSVLTIRNKTEDYWYGVAPQILNREDGSLRLIAYSISQRAGKEPIVEQRDSSTGFIDSSFLFIATGDGYIQLSTSNIVLPSQLSGKVKPPQEIQEFGVIGGGLCCVSCGDITVCGGSVVMSCGSCSNGGGGRPAV